jgi:hypothetical protein
VGGNGEGNTTVIEVWILRDGNCGCSTPSLLMVQTRDGPQVKHTRCNVNSSRRTLHTHPSRLLGCVNYS